jgi:hypothetical protein
MAGLFLRPTAQPFTYTVDPATPNTAQSGTAATGLTWEAQNS